MGFFSLDIPLSIEDMEWILELTSLEVKFFVSDIREEYEKFEIYKCTGWSKLHF